VCIRACNCVCVCACNYVCPKFLHSYRDAHVNLRYGIKFCVFNNRVTFQIEDAIPNWLDYNLQLIFSFVFALCKHCECSFIHYFVRNDVLYHCESNWYTINYLPWACQYNCQYRKCFHRNWTIYCNTNLDPVAIITILYWTHLLLNCLALS